MTMLMISKLIANISTNTDNIETNRKNIDDLGYGVAGASPNCGAVFAYCC